VVEVDVPARLREDLPADGRVHVARLVEIAMLRGIAGVVAGLIVWGVVATLGNFVLRYALPGYAEVEKAMTFTLGMQAARLALGALASLCAGVAVAWIGRRNVRAVAVLAAILFVMFVPAHHQLWNVFPLWYHVTFFVLLVAMTFAGAALHGPGASRT